MHETQLISDLALAWGAAFVGGALAQRLRQPPILGYLLAGVALGPFTPGPVIASGSIGTLADLGVAFLMFALGTEFSFDEMRHMGRLVMVGGPVQILLCMVLGPLVAYPLGLSLRQGVFLGGTLALSSTVVALKVLGSRGEVQSPHGRAALGMLIAQDLAAVPLLVVLPLVTGSGNGSLTGIALIAVKAVVILLAANIIGVRLAPWILQHAAIPQTRELFILSVMTLAIGTAFVTQAAGLSLAFGAFLAGLAVAESHYRTQVLAEVLPFRDIFTALFFVSVGLLLNPATLTSRLGQVALLVLAVVAGKGVIVALVTGALGMRRGTSILTGVTLAQMGEFSFVLIGLGLTTRAVPASLYNVVLAAALVSIIISPFLLTLGHHLATILERRARPGGEGGWDYAANFDVDLLSGHTVICGYGRVGSEVEATLRSEGLPYLVIEYNPAIVEDLQRRGVPVIYGDAGNQTVLEHAHLESAKLLTVLVPDPVTAELATRLARALTPRTPILTRARDTIQAERLRKAGASDVVQPEFEAGVAVIGYVLRQYGRSGPELARVVLGRKADFYKRGRNRG